MHIALDSILDKQLFLIQDSFEWSWCILAFEKLLQVEKTGLNQEKYMSSKYTWVKYQRILLFSVLATPTMWFIPGNQGKHLFLCKMLLTKKCQCIQSKINGFANKKHLWLCVELVLCFVQLKPVLFIYVHLILIACYYIEKKQQ